MLPFRLPFSNYQWTVWSSYFVSFPVLTAGCLHFISLVVANFWCHYIQVLPILAFLELRNDVRVACAEEILNCPIFPLRKQRTAYVWVHILMRGSNCCRLGITSSPAVDVIPQMPIQAIFCTPASTFLIVTLWVVVHYTRSPFIRIGLTMSIYSQ